MIRFTRLFLLAALLCAAAPTVAQENAPTASEVPHEAPAGAAETDETHEEAAGPYEVIFRWVNFAVLFGLLGYLLKKPASEFFEARKTGIASGLERAKRAQEDSDRRMTQIEQRLGRLSADVAELRVQAEQESAIERERMIAEAQREMERVVEQSRQEMERIALGIERDIKEKI